MIKRIGVIGVASGLGALDQGCEHGPAAVQRAPGWATLARQPLIAREEALTAPDAAGLTTVERIAGLCRHLARRIDSVLAGDMLPLVIGGDHSLAIGTWSGVARYAGAPVGLLWIDAHLDSHTPQTSPSGAIHGMPLACLLGSGDPRLLDLGIRGAQLDPAHTVVLGARSWEPEEADFLAAQGVRVIDAAAIAQRGLEACFAEALAIVAGAAHGFGVTLDLDACDPSVAPGVGTPVPGGLCAGALRDAWRQLKDCAGLRAIEIVEYNPLRERQGMTAQLICDLIGDLLSPESRADAQPGH